MPVEHATIYVVLHPRSVTNDSDKYRVVDSDAWMAYVNGAAETVPIAGEHDTYTAAEKQRNDLNGTT
jgi:hypothetical protein